eukprot:2484528-Lingulodinium_polyedra.AAC.1
MAGVAEVPNRRRPSPRTAGADPEPQPAAADGAPVAVAWVHRKWRRAAGAPARRRQRRSPSRVLRVLRGAVGDA